MKERKSNDSSRWIFNLYSHEIRQGEQNVMKEMCEYGVVLATVTILYFARHVS